MCFWQTFFEKNLWKFENKNDYLIYENKNNRVLFFLFLAPTLGKQKKKRVVAVVSSTTLTFYRLRWFYFRPMTDDVHFFGKTLGFWSTIARAASQKVFDGGLGVWMIEKRMRKNAILWGTFCSVPWLDWESITDAMALIFSRKLFFYFIVIVCMGIFCIWIFWSC